MGSIPGLGKSPGEGKGYLLHCSGLENSVACIVHWFSKSRTQLSYFQLSLKDIWVTSKYWQLQEKMQEISTCRFLCGHIFSAPLRMQLMDCMTRLFSFIRNHQYLPTRLWHVAFPPAMCENSCCFTSLWAFGIVSVLDFGHSNRYIVILHCCFDLYFPDYLSSFVRYHKYFSVKLIHFWFSKSPVLKLD